MSRSSEEILNLLKQKLQELDSVVREDLCLGAEASYYHGFVSGYESVLDSLKEVLEEAKK